MIEENSFAASPVAMALYDFITKDRPDEGFEGTATELLVLLGAKVPEATKRSRVWPQSAVAMGNAIKRIMPMLRVRGVVIDKHHSGERMIDIRWVHRHGAPDMAGPDGVPNPERGSTHG
jgi:hypothetical protein